MKLENLFMKVDLGRVSIVVVGSPHSLRVQDKEKQACFDEIST